MIPDPDTAGKRLGPQPTMDPTAAVRDSRFGAYCEVGARTRVSETTMGDHGYVVHDSEIIYAEIGRFCSIAAHTRINPGNHPLERVALNHFTYRSSAYGLGKDDAAFFDWRRSHRVVLGHDVWIGHGAVVLPGVRIGTGAAVGAGTVVARDVPEFAVAVGVPARVTRFRFPDAVRAALLRVAWWDWTHEQLRERLADFRALSAEEFCARYDTAPAAAATRGGAGHDPQRFGGAGRHPRGAGGARRGDRAGAADGGGAGGGRRARPAAHGGRARAGGDRRARLQGAAGRGADPGGGGRG